MSESVNETKTVVPWGSTPIDVIIAISSFLANPEPVVEWSVHKDQPKKEEILRCVRGAHNLRTLSLVCKHWYNAVINYPMTAACEKLDPTNVVRDTITAASPNISSYLLFWRVLNSSCLVCRLIKPDGERTAASHVLHTAYLEDVHVCADHVDGSACNSCLRSTACIGYGFKRVTIEAGEERGTGPTLRPICDECREEHTRAGVCSTVPAFTPYAHEPVFSSRVVAFAWGREGRTFGQLISYAKETLWFSTFPGYVPQETEDARNRAMVDVLAEYFEERIRKGQWRHPCDTPTQATEAEFSSGGHSFPGSLWPAAIHLYEKILRRYLNPAFFDFHEKMHSERAYSYFALDEVVHMLQERAAKKNLDREPDQQVIIPETLINDHESGATCNFIYDYWYLCQRAVRGRYWEMELELEREAANATEADDTAKMSGDEKQNESDKGCSCKSPCDGPCGQTASNKRALEEEDEEEEVAQPSKKFKEDFNTELDE